MRLYKYCPWHNNKHTRNNLKNSVLYFQQPEFLNDPFDIFPSADNSKLSGYINLSEATIQNIRNTISVCCFTNDPKNLLMWAHYADKHRGICLCFDFPDDSSIITPAPHWTTLQLKANAAVTPYSVTYLKSRPKIEFSNHNKLTDFFLIKYEAWGYENEYRAFIRDDFGEFNYDPSFLTGIIAGCKMPDEDLLELQQLIQKLSSPTELFQTVPEHHAFRLDLVKVKR